MAISNGLRRKHMPCSAVDPGEHGKLIIDSERVKAPCTITGSSEVTIDL